MNSALLPYWSQSIATNMEPLFEALHSDNFVLVYWDDHAVVMVRNDAENNALIKQYGIFYTDPFVQPESVTSSVPQIAAELKTLSVRFPNALGIQDYEQRFSISHPGY
jgi:hypothetical protein